MLQLSSLPLNHAKIYDTRSFSPLFFLPFSNKTFTGAFSPGATLLMDNGHEAVKHLFTRKTHLQFGYRELSAILIIYFAMACWAAGPSIAGGLVVPML